MRRDGAPAGTLDLRPSVKEAEGIACPWNQMPALLAWRGEAL